MKSFSFYFIGVICEICGLNQDDKTAEFTEKSNNWRGTTGIFYKSSSKDITFPRLAGGSNDTYWPAIRRQPTGSHR